MLWLPTGVAGIPSRTVDTFFFNSNGLFIQISNKIKLRPPQLPQRWGGSRDVMPVGIGTPCMGTWRGVSPDPLLVLDHLNLV